jgi:predicted SnoaL-like aldol condensation-catalyzing enzyme
VTSDREALLRDFYSAIDCKDWPRATNYLSPGCQWHILANDVTAAASVTGRESVAEWFGSALGAVETQQRIKEIATRGSGVAVFTTATVTANGSSTISEWVDVFRFAEGLIAEHVSVQTG